MLIAQNDERKRRSSSPIATGTAVAFPLSRSESAPPTTGYSTQFRNATLTISVDHRAGDNSLWNVADNNRPASRLHTFEVGRERVDVEPEQSTYAHTTWNNP